MVLSAGLSLKKKVGLAFKLLCALGSFRGDFLGIKRNKICCYSEVVGDEHNLTYLCDNSNFTCHKCHSTRKVFPTSIQALAGLSQVNQGKCHKLSVHAIKI